jgi:hypothetical protein
MIVLFSIAHLLFIFSVRHVGVIGHLWDVGVLSMDVRHGMRLAFLLI